MAESENQSDNMGHFVVEKKISIAFVFAIIVQTFLGGWWAATASAELKALKEKIEVGIQDRYTKTEAKLELRGIEKRIDRIEADQVIGLNKLRDLEIQVIKGHRDSPHTPIKQRRSNEVQ